MKKACLILLAALLLCLALPALAEIAYVHAADTDPVTLYAHSSTSSNSLGVYYTGTPVARRGETRGAFTEVTIGEETGWIMTDCLSRTQPLRTGPAGVPLPGSGWVNLRMQPAADGRIVGMLFPNTPVTILGETATGWYFTDAAGEKGYAMKDYVFAAQDDMDWSRYHYAPTERIDVAYPHFDHMPDQINGLIEAKAASLVEQADLASLSMTLDTDVTLASRHLLSIIFYGSAYVDGGAYPTTLLYVMNLDLHTLDELPAARLFDLSGGFDDLFFAQARRPAVSHDDLPADMFDDRLAQQREMAAMSGALLSEDAVCFLTDAGAVFVLPAIHASGSDYFEALLPWSALAARWQQPWAIRD